MMVNRGMLSRLQQHSIEDFFNNLYEFMMVSRGMLSRLQQRSIEDSFSNLYEFMMVSRGMLSRLQQHSIEDYFNKILIFLRFRFNSLNTKTKLFLNTLWCKYHSFYKARKANEKNFMLLSLISCWSHASAETVDKRTALNILFFNVAFKFYCLLYF